MEQEQFEVSPLKPSWVLLLLAAYGYFIYNFGDYIIGPDGWMIALVIIIFPMLIWKPMRLFIRLITFRPAVLLTQESIYIAESRDMILWTDVTDISLASNATNDGAGATGYASAYYIVIKVKDPEKYLLQIKNPILREYRRWTGKLKPSPFEIKLSWVRGDEDELYQIVLQFFRETRRN